MARIVLVGGGHTHAEVVRRASRLTAAGHTVTLVTPAATHPYSGMGPGMLGGTYSLADILLPVATLVGRAGGTFIQATAVSLDPNARLLTLSSGRTIAYDVLSLNIGSDPVEAAPIRERHVFTVKPIRELARARAAIEAACARDGRCRIAVIGGGPAGVEVAANCAFLVRRLHARAAVDLYHASDLLARLDRTRNAWVLRYLECHGVSVHPGSRVSPADLDADVVFSATGTRPPGVLASFGLPLAPDGALVVDEFLRSPSSERVFAAGDCAWFSPQPLDRVGVYPVRMQPVLFANLAAIADAVDRSLHGDPVQPDCIELTRFTATGPYLAGLNLGFGRGLLYRQLFDLRGRPAFAMKDLIDRRFVRRYQP